MPARANNSVPVLPLSSVLAEATSTTAIALAIPTGSHVVEVVGATVKHFLALGASATPDDLSAANAVILQVAGTVHFYLPRSGDFTHLWVEAAATTGTVDVSFYR